MKISETAKQNIGYLIIILCTVIGTEYPYLFKHKIKHNYFIKQMPKSKTERYMETHGWVKVFTPHGETWLPLDVYSVSDIDEDYINALR